jgi:chromosomal replication initiation ATPase DnaA
MVDDSAESKIILLVDRLDKLVPVLLSMTKEANEIIEEIQILKVNILTPTKHVHKNIITTLVTKHYDITLRQIRSSSRKTYIKNARHILAYLLLQNTEMTHEDIGQTINRDHSMMSHVRKVMLNARDTRDGLYTEYTILQQKVDKIIIDITATSQEQIERTSQ